MASRRGPRIGERGVSRVGCMAGIVVGLFVAYAAVKLVGMEIDYRSLSSEMQRIARDAGSAPDESLRIRITAKVGELGLPRSAAAATIRRLPGNRITMAVQYPDTLTFFGQWHIVWTRRIAIEQIYTFF